MPTDLEITLQKNELADSISATIHDYENNIFRDKNDREHVLRWVSQFDENDRLFVLQQTDILLRRQYFSKDKYISIINKVIENTKAAVLSNFSFLDIQANGNSQTQMLELMNNSSVNLKNINLNVNDYTKDQFVYFDDVVFTGNRVCTDLTNWIVNLAPSECKLLILSIYTHTYALFDIEKKLTEVINRSGKSISLSFRYLGRQYENKFIMRNQSDVFWPREENVYIPDDLDPTRFISFAPAGQSAGRTDFIPSYVFKDGDDRDRFERILCDKGFYIISLCNEPSAAMKPLGYKTYRGLGFGGTIFTYRNCPNNTPLVFWWGNPNMDDRNPLSQWYPLMMRSVY